MTRVSVIQLIPQRCAVRPNSLRDRLLTKSIQHLFIIRRDAALMDIADLCNEALICNQLTRQAREALAAAELSMRATRFAGAALNMDWGASPILGHQPSS